MQVGLISGSTRETGTTWRVLRKLTERWQAGAPGTFTFVEGPDLAALPLFSPERLEQGIPTAVQQWATFVKTSDLLVVATPEYAHNMPAALKSALEWLVASGEFSRKRTLAVTVTPGHPRGDYARQSLVWTLQALDAELLAEVPIYVTSAAAAHPEEGAEWLAIIDAAAEICG